MKGAVVGVGDGLGEEVRDGTGLGVIEGERVAVGEAGMLVADGDGAGIVNVAGGWIIFSQETSNRRMNIIKK